MCLHQRGCSKSRWQQLYAHSLHVVERHHIKSLKHVSIQAEYRLSRECLFLRFLRFSDICTFLLVKYKLL